jgi:hypothetical protein
MKEAAWGKLQRAAGFSPAPRSRAKALRKLKLAPLLLLGLLLGSAAARREEGNAAACSTSQSIRKPRRRCEEKSSSKGPRPQRQKLRIDEDASCVQLNRGGLLEETVIVNAGGALATYSSM